MKRIMIILIAILLSAGAFAAVPPSDESSSVVLNKISEEGKTTREFIAQIVDKKTEEFFTEFMSKAEIYKDDFDSMINSAVLKLGAMWGAILMFFLALDQTLKLRLEKKRYKVLKEAIKTDLIKEIIVMPKTAESIQAQQEPESEFVSKFKTW